MFVELVSEPGSEFWYLAGHSHLLQLPSPLTFFFPLGLALTGGGPYPPLSNQIKVGRIWAIHTD